MPSGRRFGIRPARFLPPMQASKCSARPRTGWLRLGHFAY
jgi:hypothetical protein